MSVLTVSNVSIRYKTGDFKEIGLKEYLMRKATHNYTVSEFWADRHVSFTLEKGDMLGIIGTNGAGKSTLLKVVSGIMEPSGGAVEREGNIAALLELASGFDGDLTVRENTYLRGAMLGYTKKFMDDTYDQIIDFAELRDFQDRPFKQLSSGMKSRLAFSIASQVDPDILILDEVLSVGDGAFRKKSEDKMREIISGGATTILVSHSLDQVRDLCNKVLWLHKGEQIAFGDNVQEICDQYQAFLDGGMKLSDLPHKPAPAVPAPQPAAAAPKAGEKGGRETVKKTFGKWTQKQICSCLLISALVLLLTALLEWFYFGFYHIGISVPFTYSDDGVLNLMDTKQILAGKGLLKGFPYFQDLSAYQDRTDMLCVLFVMLCGLFTKNAVLAFNLYMCAIPMANVLVSFWVLRHFKIRPWLAYLAALTFGFCPYVQFRLVGHQALGAVECIPLIIMLCIWCMEDPNFERPGRGWSRYGRNWLALFFAWMIANNGMVYYPFFSCFILLAAAFCFVLRERRLRAAAAPCLLIVQIAGWVAIGFIPTVIGILKGYGNVAANGAVRAPGGAMGLMLRLNSMLLSPKGYGISKLKEIIDSFTRLAETNDSFYLENAYSYMGITAIIGFGICLAFLFYTGDARKKGDALVERLGLLSRITLAILVLGISTGLGTLVNIWIPYIRGYNRISPFIVFCGVFAAALCAEAGLQRAVERKGPAAGCILAAAVLAVLGYGLVEQQATYRYFPAGYGGAVAEAYDADEVFVKEIEQAAGRDAMVFQLPYMRPFENGPVINVKDYDHNRGPAHSDTLRWSYGATAGTKNDRWYRAVSKLQPKEMVDELYAQGFGGIWLNLDGYEKEKGAELEADLCAAAHCDEPLRCRDGHTVFIPLSQELVYITDMATGEIRSISYEASKENVRTIQEELAGDEASVRYLADMLAKNGTDGGKYTVSLPADGSYQLHRKTPEEEGELRAVGVAAEGKDLMLENVGDHQIITLPFTIKADTLYKVEITLAEGTDFDTVKDLILDFYAGPEYDRGEQEIADFTCEGRYTYTSYFDSGAINGGSIDGFVRAFVFDLHTQVCLDTLRVTEMETDHEQQ